MQKRVSLRDIAERVGVSIALVSYVLNGREKEMRVGSEVVKKIRKAAEELNYQPNQIARSLRMQSTKTLGMIVADIANPFFGSLARIIENEAMKFGYTVVVGSSDENPVQSESLVTVFMNRQVDGFIITPTEGSEQQIRQLVENQVPVVLLDRYFPGIDVSHVVLDNRKASFDATTHMIRHGTRNITMVAYRQNLSQMEDRIGGYEEAMHHHGLNSSKHVVKIRKEHIRKDMRNMFDTLAPGKRSGSGLIFANKALALAGLYCIRQRSLKVPDDVDFVGYDGGEAFDLFSPPLTYIRQPVTQMGKCAFSILMGLINGNGKGEVRKEWLLPELIIRNTGDLPAQPDDEFHGMYY
ncbi:MAG: substrate-binding domain-containing protein [Bacteroidales bacterium]|nr:substrate-binding domain-containing protein [Bacteroidales bacterium]MDT8432050.1 substrate-binding domain-containing protein [Bacteroidales bacterium]